MISRENFSLMPFADRIWVPDWPVVSRRSTADAARVRSLKGKMSE